MLCFLCVRMCACRCYNLRARANKFTLYARVWKSSCFLPCLFSIGYLIEKRKKQLSTLLRSCWHYIA